MPYVSPEPRAEFPPEYPPTGLLTTDPIVASWVNGAAQEVSAFYGSLVSNGVPSEIAGDLTKEFNHQKFRKYFMH